MGRQVHHPWLVHAEDEKQASDEGWQEGDVREGCRGEGEASVQGGQGLLRCSAEEEHLSRQPAQVLEWTFHSGAFGQRLTSQCVPSVHRTLLRARQNVVEFAHDNSCKAL